MVKFDLPVIRVSGDKPVKTDEKVKCPKCGSTNIFKFEKEIYIVNNNDFVRKPLYGCKDCNAGFTILSGKDLKVKEGPPEVGYDRVQSVLGNLSKGCFNVLGNVR